jgi:hypothetical protein
METLGSPAASPLKPNKKWRRCCFSQQFYAPECFSCLYRNQRADGKRLGLTYFLLLSWNLVSRLKDLCIVFMFWAGNWRVDCETTESKAALSKRKTQISGHASLNFHHALRGGVREMKPVKLLCSTPKCVHILGKAMLNAAGRTWKNVPK